MIVDPYLLAAGGMKVAGIAWILRLAYAELAAWRRRVPSVAPGVPRTLDELRAKHVGSAP